jgi:hypothetical protein
MGSLHHRQSARRTLACTLDDCPFENGGFEIASGTHNQNNFWPAFQEKNILVDNDPDAK